MGEGVSHVSGFWEGCGLLVHLIELMDRGKYPQGAHLVLAMTSLTLKSKQVQKLLAMAPSKGIRVKQLLEREVAWKAWYAGRGGGPNTWWLLQASSETGNKLVNAPIMLAAASLVRVGRAAKETAFGATTGMLRTYSTSGVIAQLDQVNT